MKKNPKKTLFHGITIRLVKFINMVIMTLPFAVAWYTCYADLLWVTFYKRGHWLVIALFFLLYFLIGRIYEAYKISYNSIGEMIYSQILTCFEVDVIMYIVTLLLIRHIPAVVPALLVLAAQVIASVIWSYLSRTWYFKTFPANKTIVVRDLKRGIPELIDQYDLTKKFKVVSAIQIEDCLNDLSVLDDADTVFVVGVKSHDRNIISKYCLMNDIEAYIIPRIGDLILVGAERSEMFHFLMLKVQRYYPTFEYLAVKRIGDILLSLIALVLFSPFMIITAICIKLEDHGPILYKQCRLTKDGKKFDILKFRSMRVDAEKDGVARLSTGDNDDRITKVGRFIRKVRIDEMPQLFNIIKGDLSIVGVGLILRAT